MTWGERVNPAIQIGDRNSASDAFDAPSPRRGVGTGVSGERPTDVKSLPADVIAMRRLRIPHSRNTGRSRLTSFHKPGETSLG